ncbi:uncharacterized protein [Drosophila virilis]|uniref:Uncharacterized protein n=1 Tax=Drosophila virilis TaxID=7244 RepID=B4MDH0_DROVI|nr:uncharacterized protein LOC6635777 [Drosophila virilis]EDW71231.1 uncharacterized protein Dvir_GJ16248 [Drosophila virilis]
MNQQPRLFARQLNPGVILTQELKMKIFNYESLNREKSQLETEISQIRKQQDSIEDKLAEALAEDEFQRCLHGHMSSGPNDNEVLDIFKKHLSSTIDKLASKYERKIYLDIDLQKLKMTIEKEIMKVNDEAAAADAASN